MYEVTEQYTMCLDNERVRPVAIGEMGAVRP